MALDRNGTEGLSPDRPVSDVVRRVLAAERSHEDLEYVHQLLDPETDRQAASAVDAVRTGIWERLIAYPSRLSRGHAEAIGNPYWPLRRRASRQRQAASVRLAIRARRVRGGISLLGTCVPPALFVVRLAVDPTRRHPKGELAVRLLGTYHDLRVRDSENPTQNRLSTAPHRSNKRGQIDRHLLSLANVHFLSPVEVFGLELNARVLGVERYCHYASRKDVTPMNCVAR